MEGLNSRIGKIAKKMGGKRRLAELMGKSESQIYRWIDGTNQPRRENLEKIAQIADVSTEWLLTGRELETGEVIDSIEEAQKRHILKGSFAEKLKVVAEVSTKYAADVEPEKLAMDVMDSDAMEPTLHNGEIFVYDRTQNDLAKSGEGIYTFVLDGRKMTRRLQLLPDSSIEIICDNPIYKNTTIQPSEVDFEIYGRARPTR